MTGSASVSNEVSGYAGNLVQVRDVQGGVHIHGSTKKVLVPRQLPAVSRFFVGRDGDIVKLDALLRDGATAPRAVVISTVVGIAGVGKTTLAIQWADRLSDRFPDGTLYINLRGYDPGPPLAPREVIERFLRTLGVPVENIPSDTEEQAAMYRSLLSGQRVLIVLDNAVSSAQVRPLLPASPGCLVLITSRNRLSGLAAHNGAVRVTLQPLSPADSFELLRQVIGEGRVDAEPDAARQLAERCGHLPLALRIAAERVAARPHTGLADLVDDLAQDPGRLDLLAMEDDDATAVTAVFSWSYLALPVNVARVFRLLGLHSGTDVDLSSVAAMADLPVSEAARIMDILVASHLVEQTARDRYELHDLLKAYATACVTSEESPEERDAAVRRLLIWYAHASTQAAPWVDTNPHVPLPPGDLSVQAVFIDREEVVGWYATEFSNLLSAVRLAVDTGNDDIAWRLSESLHGYIVLTKRLSEGLAVSRLGVEAARRRADQVGEALLLNMQAHVLSDLHLDADALDVMKKSLALWRSVGNVRGQARALNNIGFCYRQLGEHDAAVDYLTRSLTLSRAERDPLLEGYAMTNLGETYRRMGRLTEAMENLEIALTLRRETADLWGLGFALTNMADTYLDLHRVEQAIEVLEEALVVRRKIGDRWGEAQTLQSLGIAMRDIARPDAARDAWERALVIFDALNDSNADDVRRYLQGLANPTTAIDSL